MKSIIKFSLFWLTLGGYTPHGQAVESKVTIDTTITNLNVLTFKPVIHSSKEERSIDEVCTAIQKGVTSLNSNAYVKIGGEPWELSTDVPTDYKDTIFIYVPGYAGISGNARYKYAGAGAYAVYLYIQAGIMKNGISISFDGPVNDRKAFNFGQQFDQDCLDTIYQETIKRNPEARVVLVGSCKGATTILNYLSHENSSNNLHAIAGVILESPSSSLEALTEHVARNHLPTLLQPVLPPFFKAVFPNYRWHQPTIIDNAAYVPDTIPIFIGCLTHDKVASRDDMYNIVLSLKNAHKSVELFEYSDKAVKHGRLASVKEYRQAAQHFLHTVLKK